MHISFHSISKESTSTSALPKTTLHDVGKLASVSIPYSTSTSALPKTTTLQ